MSDVLTLTSKDTILQHDEIQYKLRKWVLCTPEKKAIPKTVSEA
jgi:hypothetical protein